MRIVPINITKLQEEVYDMDDHKLIVITGSIAAGKSTTAISVGRCLRSRGATTAVVGLDELYLVGKQNDNADWEWNEPEAWSAARRASGALAESFFASGYNTFVVEGGDFRSEFELNQLLSVVKSGVVVLFFTLFVSCDEMLRRAKGDSNRQPVRSEVGYRKMHASFVSQLPFLRDIGECIDADHLTPDQIAIHITNKVLGTADSG